MAKFIDGGGVERIIGLRHKHLAAVRDKYGVDLQATFREAYYEKSTDKLISLMFGDSERLASIVLELSDVPAAEVAAVKDDLDGAAFDSMRLALHETLADFCLPLALRKPVTAAFNRDRETTTPGSGGSNKVIDLPV